MVELWKFIFSEWYIFLGTFFLLAMVCSAIANMFKPYIRKEEDKDKGSYNNEGGFLLSEEDTNKLKEYIKNEE